MEARQQFLRAAGQARLRAISGRPPESRCPVAEPASRLVRTQKGSGEERVTNGRAWAKRVTYHSAGHLSCYMWAIWWICAWTLVAAAAAQEVKLNEVATGFTRPTDIQHPDDGSGRLYVLEQSGYVRVIRNGAPQLVMDITDRVTRIGSGGDERGLLGLAFPKDFKAKQYF